MLNSPRVIRSFTYRLYPTATQAAELDRWLAVGHELYNNALQHRIASYRQHGRTVGYAHQSKELTEIRAECDEYRSVPATMLRGPLKRLEKAMVAFFRRVKRGQTPGFPRFQSFRRWRSLDIAQWGASPVVDGGIHLPKMGTVRAKIHRPLQGVPKTGTLMKLADGWHLRISCVDVPTNPLPPTDRSVGIDLGLRYFFATSDGEVVANPRFLQRAHTKMRRKQRAVARKQKGSNHRKRAVRELARLHLQIRRTRRDFHHKVALALVQAYDTIAIENLNVKDLARSRLAKSVCDVGWAQFLQILREKAECAARQVVGVSARGTSQTCPRCGRVEKKSLSERFHACECGLFGDRDYVSSIEILARAGPAYANASGCAERCA